MGLRGPIPKPTGIKALEGNPGRRPLPKEPNFAAEATVYETIAAGLGDASRLLLGFHESAKAVSPKLFARVDE